MNRRPYLPDKGEISYEAKEAYENLYQCLLAGTVGVAFHRPQRGGEPYQAEKA